MVSTTLRVGEALPTPEFRRVRHEAIFACCKWDPQVGDVSVLAPWPLVLARSEWQQLAALAEQLAQETAAIEQALLCHPGHQRELYLPWALRRALAAAAGNPSASAARLMRFDFHWTTQGWRVSEVNADVPGGFNEASGFTALMARHYPALQPAGDPALALAQALAQAAGGGPVGLIHATAYVDDREVMEYLKLRLAELGAPALLLSPDHVSWHAGKATVGGEALGAMLRYFPAEWLPNLGRRAGWRNFFAGAATPACNPATALLTQSKRLPLTWPQLGLDLPAWRALLPETRDPRAADWETDAGWVVKPALGRVGEAIGIHGVTPEKEWREIRKAARRRPRHWVAQRRFEAVAFGAAGGSIYPCIGVYTVNGKACGAYGRAGQRALVDGKALEAAVLLAQDGA